MTCDSWPAWRVAVPGLAGPDGSVALRPEQPADAPFLCTLFRSSAAPLDGVPADMAEALLDMQWRGQTASYRAAYPHACYAIIQTTSGPCGRLIYDRGAMSRIIDYALLPDCRGTGVGTAVLRAVLARVGGPVQSTVQASNRASLGMCRKLGFAVLTEDAAFLTLEWRPDAAA